MPAPPPAPAGVERDVERDWRPEPLADEGQAELARRLVTADPERWSASVLAPLLVASAAEAPLDPPGWPDRRKAKPVNDFLAARFHYLWGSIGMGLFALFAEGEIVLELALLAVALPLGVGAAIGPWLYADHRRAERLTRAVRRAAASPPRALEEGLPGAAGLFAVARGRRRGIAIVHVRPAVIDGRRGELEVRTLARLQVPDDDLDALGTFCDIADEAQHRSRAVGRSTRTLRLLVARLGRVPALAGEPRLREEPLAWAAALPIGGLVILSIVTPSWFAANRALGVVALLLTSCLLLYAARRVRDPFAL
jgi:hypothetical protein